MSARAPDAVLWDFLRGATMTRALGIVAELSVADALVDGPLPVDDIARETGAHSDTLYRLLRALASDGVFAEVEPRVFQNTEISELLRSGEPNRDFATLFGGVWYRAIADLDVRTGDASFPDTFGADFWSWLAQNPDERAAFDRAMEDGTERRVDRLETLGWHGDETVVDVGGGNGALLVELCRRRPGLHGIIFDLPETNRDEAAWGERLEFVAGSFFDRVPEGDVYVLGTILHDWDDEHAGAILATIRAHAPSHARVVIIDSVLEPGNEPSGAKWLDLLMLVLFRGRERTEEEWRVMIEAAGFTVDALQDGLIQASCR
jgi:hypothetical protein